MKGPPVRSFDAIRKVSDVFEKVPGSEPLTSVDPPVGVLDEKVFPTEHVGLLGIVVVIMVMGDDQNVGQAAFLLMADQASARRSTSSR